MTLPFPIALQLQLLMKTIQTTDSKLLPYPLPRIWKVISDLATYSAWWPARIGIKTLLRTRLLSVRLRKRMDPSYVRHYLNSPVAKAFAAEENRGMTREQINLANAKALPVSVPPLAEQRRIVAKVDQLMALVDALETQLASSCATAANLLSALVAELTVGCNLSSPHAFHHS